jgi:hypothetical protein
MSEKVEKHMVFKKAVTVKNANAGRLNLCNRMGAVSWGKNAFAAPPPVPLSQTILP